MDTNFSHTNLQYFIQLRDLARQSPAAVALMTGLSQDLIHMLSQVSAAALSTLAQLNTPPLMMRREAWWWKRLLRALQDDRREELAAVLAHAPLAVVNPMDSGSAL